MIEGFENLHSTKIGRIAERIVREFNSKVLGFSIEKDLDKEYDTDKDIVFYKDGIYYSVEIKGDNYPKGNNIPLEFQQENLLGEMVDSGIRKTKSDILQIYCFRDDSIYEFKTPKLKDWIEKYTTQEDVRICNEDSTTGKTACYILDISLLQLDGVIDNTHSDVIKELKNSGWEYVTDAEM